MQTTITARRSGVSQATRHWLGRHLLFWVICLIFFTIVSLPYNGTLTDCVMVALFWLPLYALMAYLFLYGWLFRWLLAGQVGRFLAGLGAWLLLGLGTNFLFRAFVLLPYQRGIWLQPNNDTYTDVFSTSSVVGIIAVVGVAVGLKLLRHGYQREQANQHLLTETLAVTLQILKAQIHPHFLFNTLNNLYAFTLRQSPDAPDLVLKLTGLLQYMIYDCNTPTVLLTREIEFLRNYIDLETVRYGSRLQVSVDIRGDIFTKTVAPLLLIPFVENAFKHGSANQLGQSYIHLTINSIDNQLRFRIANSLTPDSRPGLSGGIGLTNVRKRLELLYPDGHSLTIQPEPTRFVVDLTLDLARLSLTNTDRLFFRPALTT